MIYSPYDNFSNIMFSVVPVVIAIIFMLVFCVIIANFIRGARQWKSNNDSPVLTVDAVVVAKRADTRHHHHNTAASNAHHMSSTTSTTYYATFEVSSGDRMELVVRDTEYGMLVENDKGSLTFQGTRYMGFERYRNK